MNNTLSENSFNLILVDDHPIYLDGLESILSTVNQFNIIGTANHGRNALSLIEKNTPDVLITDLNMPEMDGITLTRKVKEIFPSIKVLVLSMLTDRETVEKIMDAEAEGFVLKTANKSELVKAISTVAEGDTYYSNEIMNIMLARYKRKEKQEEAAQELTARELEILQLIAQELTSEKIADQLFISRRTVETHRRNILEKTNCTTLIGLLKYAVRHNLIQLK